MTSMSCARAKAMPVPSGDQVGCPIGDVLLTIACRCVPSAFMTPIPPLRRSLPVVTAILVPSGDQAGSERPIAGVICLTFPAGVRRKIASRFEPPCAVVNAENAMGPFGRGPAGRTPGPRSVNTETATMIPAVAIARPTTSGAYGRG